MYTQQRNVWHFRRHLSVTHFWVVWRHLDTIPSCSWTNAENSTPEEVSMLFSFFFNNGIKSCVPISAMFKMVPMFWKRAWILLRGFVRCKVCRPVIPHRQCCAGKCLTTGSLGKKIHYKYRMCGTQFINNIQ